MKNTKMFLILLFLIITKPVFANDLFYDNFESATSLDNWVHASNVGDSGSWVVKEDGLHSYAVSNSSSFLCLKNTNLPSNYSFEAKVKNVSGVDQSFIFRSNSERSSYYLVDYRYNDPDWSWDNNNIKLYKVLSGDYKLLGSYPSDEYPRTIGITQGIEHDVKISLNGNKIKIAFDNEVVINAIDEDEHSLEDGGFCLMTWGGNIPKLSENIYREVRIKSHNEEKNKIILLPGLGASWNTEAITVGSTHVDSKWTMTPFVKNYDKLISAFESNSLVRGQDYYVWNYDWRKPLSQIVADFDTFVTSLNLSENEKLNLVGHSLGGLVARLWTQDHGEKVNKTVTLGSPHYGSVKAYLAWNGLKFGDNSMANIALNVFLGLKNGEVRVKNVREFAPIIFDLNPTFSFLKKNSNPVISASSQYLQEMNNGVNLINPLLVTVDGVGVDTLSGISLGERTMFDKVFGVWEEGRPIAYEKSIGDGTVLKKSALVEGSKNIEKVSNHSDLVDKTINEVMDELGLNRPITLLKRGVVLAANPEMSIFFTDLDGDMKVVCNGEEKNDIEGWVWFEGVDGENCKASFTGGANSEYRLVVGGGDQWQSFKGVLNSEGRAEIDLNPKDFSWMLLRQKASELGATQMIAAIDKKNILTTINAYINFRAKNKNSQHSEEIIESLRIILESENKTRAEIERQYRATKNAKVVAESNLRLMVRKKMKPSFYSSLTYNQAEGLMMEGKNYAANYLAEKLYKIIWR